MSNVNAESIQDWLSLRVRLSRVKEDNRNEVILTIEEAQAIIERIANLEGWKESQLAVEAEWDCQEVARELGIPPGRSIRREIMPAIKAMKERIAESPANNPKAGIAPQLLPKGDKALRGTQGRK